MISLLVTVSVPVSAKWLQKKSNNLLTGSNRAATLLDESYDNVLKHRLKTNHIYLNFILFKINLYIASEIGNLQLKHCQENGWKIAKLNIQRAFFLLS